jgi:hypothetical protein
MRRVPPRRYHESAATTDAQDLRRPHQAGDPFPADPRAFDAQLGMDIRTAVVAIGRDINLASVLRQHGIFHRSY